MWVQTIRGHGVPQRWYAPTLWQTMTASAWWSMLRKHGFGIRLRRLPLAAVVSAITAANSVFGLLQSALFSARLGHIAVAPDPIFIVGHYRAGTTHLHNLLAQDERLSFPTMFECACPHHCLVTGRIYPKLFAWMLPAKRAMDDVRLAFDLPQEDELGLLALGAPSPYWSLAFPGNSAGEAFLSLRTVTDRERESWEQIFLGFLRLVSYRRPGTPLILKSPPHTARIAMLTRLLPGARFVHIVRHPLEVFASTVRLWRSTRAGNALAAWDDAALEREVLAGYRRCTVSSRRRARRFRLASFTSCAMRI